MGVETTNDILNRLMVIHSRSLPVYLTYAPPWWKDENGRIAEALKDLALDQLGLAERIGGMLLANGGTPVVGQFPDRFMAFHDLEFGFLITEILGYEERTISVIERLLPALSQSAEAQALAQEALGSAKAHRDILSELQRDLADVAAP
jgi:hypothetical protein